MKLKISYLFILLSLLTVTVFAQSLTVGTFNLRFANPKDAGNLWADRAPVVSSLIQFHEFDVLGTQEGLKSQMEDLEKALPEYQRYGLGRDGGQDEGEHSAIFFKRSKFKLLNKGDFWLSETPDKPSLGWDATCCNRICSWVYLQDVQSKKKFYFFNVHYDHQGVVAREESSKLILQKIKDIAKAEPVILTGDFNGDHESSWYKRVATSGLLKDTYTSAERPYALNASFNSFGTGSSLKGNAIIDHIFATAGFAVSKWGVLTDTYHGKFPSDHFPVLAKVMLK